jgi:hypothetical protein
MEELLEAEDLNPFLTCLLDEFEMFLDHVLLDLLLGLISRNITIYLSQTASYDSWHLTSSLKKSFVNHVYRCY